MAAKNTSSTTKQLRKRIVPDSEVFLESVMPHQPSVFAFALSLAGDRSVAEDLVQDTLLRAWRSFTTFTIGSDCRAWLFKICKNRFFDLCRERKRRARFEDLEVTQPVAKEMPYEVARDLDRRLLGKSHDPELLSGEIKRAIEEIPGEFSEPIIMNDLDELKYSEIAEILQIPLGTVRSRIARGRALLRRRLCEYAAEFGFGHFEPSEAA